jgi:hypothetical protein
MQAGIASDRGGRAPKSREYSLATSPIQSIVLADLRNGVITPHAHREGTRRSPASAVAMAFPAARGRIVFVYEASFGAFRGKLMLTRTLAALAATCAATCSAQTDRELLVRVDQMRQELAARSTPTGTEPNTCGVAPLPLTPVGPTVTATWRFGTSDTVAVTGWRIPCSAAESMPVLTLQPSTGDDPSFFCGAGMVLLQSGGLQTDAFSFYTDPFNSSSFCTDVVAPVTVAFVPRFNTPANFDFDQGFSIDFDGASAGHQTLAMFPYDPSQYIIGPQPGSDSVEIHVHGPGIHYRSCHVSTTTVGAGHQYSATCDSESSIKVGGFERHDY